MKDFDVLRNEFIRMELDFRKYWETPVVLSDTHLLLYNIEQQPQQQEKKHPLLLSFSVQFPKNSSPYIDGLRTMELQPTHDHPLGRAVGEREFKPHPLTAEIPITKTQLMAGYNSLTQSNPSKLNAFMSLNLYEQLTDKGFSVPNLMAHPIHLHNTYSLLLDKGITGKGKLEVYFQLGVSRTGAKLTTLKDIHTAINHHGLNSYTTAIAEHLYQDPQLIWMTKADMIQQLDTSLKIITPHQLSRELANLAICDAIKTKIAELGYRYDNTLLTPNVINPDLIILYDSISLPVTNQLTQDQINFGISVTYPHNAKKAAISALAVMYTRGNLKTKELATLAEKHYMAADSPIPSRAAARGEIEKIVRVTEIHQRLDILQQKGNTPPGNSQQQKPK